MRNLKAVPLTNEGVADATRAVVRQQGKRLPPLHRADQLLERTLEQGPLVGRSMAETELLVEVSRWAHDFLTKPHPDLGRSGPVCPYVAATIREQRFLITTIRNAATNQRETDATMLRLGQLFLRLNPATGRLAHRKTIVVLFPDLPEHEVSAIINGVHQRLKPDFLHRGMMLGEFYDGSSKPGLHNPEFRPLRSKTPLMVIRSMVPIDIAFLTDKPGFISAFLKNFKARGSVEIHNYIARKGSALSPAEISMLLEQIAQNDPATSGVRPRVTTSGCPVHGKHGGDESKPVSASGSARQPSISEARAGRR